MSDCMRFDDACAAIEDKYETLAREQFATIISAHTDVLIDAECADAIASEYADMLETNMRACIAERIAVREALDAELDIILNQ